MPATEKAHPYGGSRTRQGRVRESAKWIQSLRALGRSPSGVLWVVADRGADIYEHLQHCQTQGLGFMACIIVGVVLTVRYFGQFPRPAVA